MFLKLNWFFIFYLFLKFLSLTGTRMRHLENCVSSVSWKAHQLQYATGRNLLTQGPETITVPVPFDRQLILFLRRTWQGVLKALEQKHFQWHLFWNLVAGSVFTLTLNFAAEAEASPNQVRKNPARKKTWALGWVMVWGEIYSARLAAEPNLLVYSRSGLSNIFSKLLLCNIVIIRSTEHLEYASIGLSTLSTCFI